MLCPHCQSTDDKVVDSREIQDGAGIRRRRECLNCGHRFTTYETITREELKVLKRNGVLEDFDRAKLRSGIERACWKRPIGDDDIDKLVDSIVSEIEKDYDKEVPSKEIGKRVMNALAKVDEVAYVRFASVYRRFKDVDEFISEIKKIEEDS
ncbi:MAG TPA: transcriptional regulator NrdR [Victivallales bacterium]|nr:transcriptional regulator NrdR [Victivallales bacterium]HRR06763.1 transcriptional regulator NrdR [Victivallales bacterium]HRR28961.1 transcriptional regulator NrdR [Victivallales bacterium]HRU01268.1 transcriptional regulator NrdR [Victivallales bacterium]